MTKSMVEGNAFKQIGNAVPPKLAYFLAEMIKVIDSENI